LLRSASPRDHWQREQSGYSHANATPDHVLAVLTPPGGSRRWSPVDFDLDALDERRLAAGTADAPP
jgi:hypothetical protein